jgi:PTH1 family peptidyl-tRNA hydrolase
MNQEQVNNAQWIVVGLGNPGKEYAETRHNVGRMATDLIKGMGGALPSELELITPSTYMNLSGGPVAKAMQKSKANGMEPRLIIVHDDIDLPFGEVKVSVGKGSGGQRGVQDIIKAIKTKDFVRVRIGIVPVYFGKARKPKGSKAVSKFVLKSFGITERCKLPEVLERASNAIITIVEDGAQIAMNKFN